VERRRLKGEKIPNAETIDSVFEPHTRWISKGNAGKLAAFDGPVCVMENHHPFGLGHQISWEGGDCDVIVRGMRSWQQYDPTLKRVSRDTGWGRPTVYADLADPWIKSLCPRWDA